MNSLTVLLQCCSMALEYTLPSMACAAVSGMNTKWHYRKRCITHGGFSSYLCCRGKEHSLKGRVHDFIPLIPTGSTTFVHMHFNALVFVFSSSFSISSYIAFLSNNSACKITGIFSKTQFFCIVVHFPPAHLSVGVFTKMIVLDYCGWLFWVVLNKHLISEDVLPEFAL